jgi:hypothetical protein
VQATPARQHWPDEHCVVPAGQPQMPRETSRQATPAGQQRVPHGVVPDGQPQRPVDESTHAVPAGQQAGPHGVRPLGQVATHVLVARSQTVPPVQQLLPQTLAEGQHDPWAQIEFDGHECPHAPQFCASL